MIIPDDQLEYQLTEISDCTDVDKGVNVVPTMIDVSTKTNNCWRPYTKTSTLTLQRSIRKRTTKCAGCQSVNQIDLLSPIRSIAAPILNSTLSRKSLNSEILTKSKVRTSQNLKTFRAKIIGDTSPLKPILVSGNSSGISCLELVDDVNSNHVNNRIVNSEIENNSVNNDVASTDTVSDGIMVKSKVDNFNCGSDHSFLNMSTETFVDDEVNDPSFDPVEWVDVVMMRIQKMNLTIWIRRIEYCCMRETVKKVVTTLPSLWFRCFT